MKYIGSWLIKIGYTILALSFGSYLLILQIPGEIANRMWIVVIISAMGIILTVIGAILDRKDMGYWLVMIGIILIYVGILLAAITAVFDRPYLFIQDLIIPCGLIGIVSVIIGGLVPDKEKEDKVD